MNTPVYDSLVKVLEWVESDYMPQDIKEAVQVLRDYLQTFDKNN